ncbi:beta-defensin 129 [Molossus nigricans]|uniref:Defensin beta 129 n=1 Tax=Molossus molossus TaxID=27622 RepID=A0A7J8HGM3_MOLMO|nr:beta-defensin 129 [Molossus molossus]KAF6471085.1 defensin beta 129 [Molossus molossus]
MKLLFPVFASLMLQYQVNTELFGSRCLMSFGRCRNQCAVYEKEVQKCKKKKCCVGLQIVQMLKNYLQKEMPHVFEEDIQKWLNATKNSRAMIQTKYNILSVSPKIRSPFANIDTIIISNANTVNSATTNLMISGKITYPATSTKSDTKKSRGSTTDSPQPSPPP